MSDEFPPVDEDTEPLERQEFHGPGEWKAQANRVEKPNPAWDMPDA